MPDSKEGFYHKLKGRLFGLLCEKEKDGPWEKFLDTILVELYGLARMERTINYWPLIGKLTELKVLNYEYFRKTIFECMNIVEELMKSERVL